MDPDEQDVVVDSEITFRVKEGENREQFVHQTSALIQAMS